MGRKRVPGLIKRGDAWHIDKQVRGRRLRESCGTGGLQEAEQYLIRRLEEIRQASIYGVRPTRTFEEAAAKFVRENQHKRSLRDDITRFRQLMPWIGGLGLDRVSMSSLKTWIDARRKEGVRPGTINHGLKVVRRVLNLAASEWTDEYGMTWLSHAPKIRLLPDKDKRQPYPLSWDEQARLFSELPVHLAEMALFAVNTGCRDAEVCRLQWDWECAVPELGTIMFIIPARFVKNGDERLVVLNDVARSVIETRRGKHPTHVFAFNGKPVFRMLNGAWLRARERAGLTQVRVHDLKHTFGRRLRASGVSFEDRQDLLGHRSTRMTTHYSAPELSRLLKAANQVCERKGTKPQLVMLRRRSAA